MCIVGVHVYIMCELVCMCVYMCVRVHVTDVFIMYVCVHIRFVLVTAGVGSDSLQSRGE